jgi:hypothetical protein
MYRSRTPEEIDAANKYHTWCRGWRDGAGTRAMRPDHVAHPTLGTTYNEAYAAGQEAARVMAVDASNRFGYTPSVLRTADTDNRRTSAETNGDEEPRRSPNADHPTQAETPAAIRQANVSIIPALVCPQCGARIIAAAPPDVIAALGYSLACGVCRTVFDPPADQQRNGQDTLSLYIAGGSSERLTVGRPWIDRAIAEGVRITYDWTRADGYEDPDPSIVLLRRNAGVDAHAVFTADILWILAPKLPSEGAWTEYGIALAATLADQMLGTKKRLVVSGRYARRNLFALLADEIYETHEDAWAALLPRVAPRPENA